MKPQTYYSTVAMVFCAVFLVGCAEPAEIVHGLNELEANEILVVLGSQDISATKKKEEGRVVTWAVVVEESDRQAGLSLLVKNRMPKKRAQGLAEVYPAGGGGLIPTKSEEKAKYLMAIQGEIERKLKTLPGAQEAHVSVVIPDKDIIRDLDTPPPPATAAVALIYNANEEGGPPAEEQKIKDLVAASVEDLRGENVTVLMSENRAMLNVIGASGVKDPKKPKKNSNMTFANIAVENNQSMQKLKVLIGALGGAAGIFLLLGIAGVVRAMSQGRKLAKAQNEIAALKRAKG